MGDCTLYCVHMFIERTVVKWVYYNEGRKSDYFSSASLQHRRIKSIRHPEQYSRPLCAYLLCVVVVMCTFYLSKRIGRRIRRLLTFRDLLLLSSIHPRILHFLSDRTWFCTELRWRRCIVLFSGLLRIVGKSYNLKGTRKQILRNLSRRFNLYCLFSL